MSWPRGARQHQRQLITAPAPPFPLSDMLTYFVRLPACLFLFRSPANEAELLASVRERYTTVKRLVVRPAAPAETGDGGSKVVEVQFTGPQPSEGPGALLCDLLHGTSVEAKPVELPRGRKKRARMDASSEASDSGERARWSLEFFSSLVSSLVQRTSPYTPTAHREWRNGGVVAYCHAFKRARAHLRRTCSPTSRRPAFGVACSASDVGVGVFLCAKNTRIFLLVFPHSAFCC